jgi:hypothetical protein
MRLRKIPAGERPTLERFVAKGPWTPQLLGDHAVMPAVPELVEWQLLAGLQMVIAPFAVVTPLDRLSMAWAHVARAGVASILDLDPGDLPGTYASRRGV